MEFDKIYVRLIFPFNRSVDLLAGQQRRWIRSKSIIYPLRLGGVTDFCDSLTSSRLCISYSTFRLYSVHQPVSLLGLHATVSSTIFWIQFAISGLARLVLNIQLSPTSSSNNKFRSLNSSLRRAVSVLRKCLCWHQSSRFCIVVVVVKEVFGRSIICR